MGSAFKKGKYHLIGLCPPPLKLYSSIIFWQTFPSSDIISEWSLIKIGKKQVVGLCSIKKVFKKMNILFQVCSINLFLFGLSEIVLRIKKISQKTEDKVDTN